LLGESSLSSDASTGRAERIGPRVWASWDWYTAKSRVRPPSTSVSKTRSVWSRPAWGNDPATLSIFTARLGRSALAEPLAGSPVSGKTAGGAGGAGLAGGVGCTVSAVAWVARVPPHAEARSPAPASSARTAGGVALLMVPTSCCPPLPATSCQGNGRRWWRAAWTFIPIGGFLPVLRSRRERVSAGVVGVPPGRRPVPVAVLDEPDRPGGEGAGTERRGVAGVRGPGDPHRHVRLVGPSGYESPLIGRGVHAGLGAERGQGADRPGYHRVVGRRVAAPQRVVAAGGALDVEPPHRGRDAGRPGIRPGVDGGVVAVVVGLALGVRGGAAALGSVGAHRRIVEERGVEVHVEREAALATPVR